MVKLPWGTSSLLSCPGKDTGHLCREGMSPVHGEGVGTLKMDFFFIMFPWYLGGMCLNSIDSTFIFIHLEISASKNNSLFIFPLLTHFKKRKWLYSGNLLLGYCQLKYLVSPVLIKRQQMEASLSTGAIPSVVGVVQNGSLCSPSNWGMFTLHCSFVSGRSKSTYRLPWIPKLLIII